MMLPFFSLLLLLFFAPLSARENEQVIEQLEEQMNQVSSPNAHGTYGSASKGSRPQGYLEGPFAFGQALYWHPTQNGLEYGVIFDGATPPSSLSTMTNGQVVDIVSKWSWGFRAGVGYNLLTNGWDLLLGWTHFRSTSTGSVAAPSGGALAAVWVPLSFTAGTPFAASATSRWRLKYDVLDFEIGRHYFVSKALCVRPFTSIRAAWIDQRINYNYTPYAFSAFNPTQVALRNHFGGFGCRAGFDLNWHFTKDWSLYGRTALSILYGRFKLQNDYEQTLSNPSLNAGSFTNNEKVSRVKSNFESELGIQWSHSFFSDVAKLTLALGYQFAIWFNQNQLTQFTLPTTTNLGEFIPRHGDLGFNGGTFIARIDF